MHAILDLSASRVLLSFTWIIINVRCQMSDNTPPTIYLERNWKIPDNESVGSKIAQAHGSDNDGGTLTYGLEAINYGTKEDEIVDLPFRIDPDTGTVYLKDSLKGKGGQDLHLYVTVSDGQFQAKTEVYVNILNSSNPQAQRKGLINPHQPHFAFTPHFPPAPPFGNIPLYNTNPSKINPAIFNNPRPMPRPVQTSTKSPFNRSNNQKIHLNPVLPAEPKVPPHVPRPPPTPRFQEKKKVELDGVELTNDVANQKPKEQAIKQAPNVNAIPILSVCAVFFIVGAIAVAFRKKIYLKKKSSSKDNMEKESYSSGPPFVVSRDDQTGAYAMQHWNGPRAFSNRYEPWGDKYGKRGEANQNSMKSSDPWEFPRHRLKFFNILGEGAFGQVWKCEATYTNGKNESTNIVAVKTLKESANEKEKSDLLSELEVMKTLDPHPNVVRLLGCCTEMEPVFLIMEYVSKGKLQSYLRSSRAERYYNNMHGPSKTLTSRDLTSFIFQVAKGMDYLSNNGIIHRDLAARNVLITEDHVCKVADFGFSRTVAASHLVYERKSEGRLPIRWMAPESLYDNIFSIKSDVWSFGVLMWEVVTLGSTPYPGMSAAEVMKKVRDGVRLDKPEHCRRELYNIMFYCWDNDPKKRPTFLECVQLLEKLLMSETEYIELERFPDHSYYNMMSLSGEKL